MKGLNNTDTSLISKDDSNALKGLLIILMVLSHNTLLMTKNISDLGDKSAIYHIINSFHTFIFLLLPFLYNPKKFTLRTFLDNVARLLVPYTIFFIVYLAIALSLGYVQFDIQNVLTAFFVNSFSTLKEGIGFQIIWFLPAIFITITLRDIFFTVNVKYRLILFFISCVFIVFFLFDLLFYKSQFFPNCIAVGLVILPMGVIIREITTKFGKKNVYVLILSAVLAIVCCFVIYLNTYGYPISRSLMIFCSRVLSPIVFFSLFLGFVDKLGKSGFLRRFGVLSLYIYLIHIIVYNALLVFSEYVCGSPTYIMGLIIFVLTVPISYCVAIIIRKIKFLDKLVFPKSFFKH